MKYELTVRAEPVEASGLRPRPPPLVLRSQGQRGGGWWRLEGPSEPPHTLFVILSDGHYLTPNFALRAGIRGGADTRTLLCRRKPRASAPSYRRRLWLRNQTLTTVEKRLTGLFTHGEYSEPSRRRDRGMSLQRVITWFLGVPQSQPQLAYETQESDVGPIAMDADIVTSILKGRRQRRRRTTFRGFHSPPGRF